MTKRQVRQYEMLVRVRQFETEHREQFPDTSEGGMAFAMVTAAGPNETIFNACVELLLWMADLCGTSYKAINVYIFVKFVQSC